MKIKIINSFHGIFVILLLVLFMVLSSCSGKQQNAHNEPPTRQDSVAALKTPSIDIFTAALFGDLKAINYYIKSGADLDQKDQYGSSPLIIATIFGKTDVSKALIDAGADPDLQNGDGSTALFCAAFFCRTEIVKALIDNGADKSIKNKSGATALESVSGPFKDVKGIYDQFSKSLGPLGLKLDYERIEKTRPVIAEMLK